MKLKPLIEAINDRNVISGLTHNIYRYPARFSPVVARAAIKLFTKPGDTVLDVFAGGGTSLVESGMAGRNAVGTDISRLAVFLSKAKTMVLSQRKLENVLDWAVDAASLLSPLLPVNRHEWWKDQGYQRNVPWRFRKAAEQGLNLAESLSGKSRVVARCMLLRTVQWAIDCKKHIPSISSFRDKFLESAVLVTNGFAEYAASARKAGRTSIEVFRCCVQEIDQLESGLLKASPPKLVVTSPPYPGIHVLYHRWQVRGRRETPAPFWIANCLDGEGSGYYTFCDRRNQRHEDIYFERLLSAYSAVRKVVADGCFVVQLVGFSNKRTQLPRYLKAMKSAGFKEHAGRLPFWRAVPNRKWYTRLESESPPASEVLLIHRAN